MQLAETTEPQEGIPDMASRPDLCDRPRQAGRFLTLKTGHLTFNHPSDQLSPRTPAAIFNPDARIDALLAISPNSDCKKQTRG